MIILPVDQGFEHGPARSFAPNPPAYDPAYHFQLAIDAGLNAYASLKTLQESERRIPFIVLSGEINQSIIDGMTKAGASEYLCKYEMAKIVPTIERAMQTGTPKS